MIFELIEAVLALVGLGSLVLAGAALVALSLEDDRPVVPDPYREGLDASARITAAGWEAERALFRAALDAQSAKRGQR